MTQKQGADTFPGEKKGPIQELLSTWRQHVVQCDKLVANVDLVRQHCHNHMYMCLHACRPKHTKVRDLTGLETKEVGIHSSSHQSGNLTLQVQANLNGATPSLSKNVQIQMLR